MKFFRRCRTHFVRFDAFARLPMSRFVQKIFATISLEIVENRININVYFGPQFLGDGRPRLFYGRLLARFTAHRLAKFGRVPFADLRLRSLATNDAEFA